MTADQSSRMSGMPSHDALKNAAPLQCRSGSPAVFADSRPAVALARQRGLSLAGPIRTNAPALLRDPSFQTEPADDLLTAQNIHAIEDGIFAAAEDIYRRSLCEYEGPFNREDIALIAARIVCGQLQDFLFPGASLRQQDFASPPVVVTPYHGRADQRYWFRAGILNFFDGDEQVDAIEIPASELPPVEGPQPDEPSLWFRLRHLGAEAYIFKLGLAVWERAAGCRAAEAC